MKHIGLGLTALCLSAALLSTVATGVTAQSNKHHSKVMYQAHCGKMYTASQAKRYHYRCPMDHKPLMKMSKNMHGRGSQHGDMNNMKM